MGAGSGGCILCTVSHVGPVSTRQTLWTPHYGRDQGHNGRFITDEHTMIVASRLCVVELSFSWTVLS